MKYLENIGTEQKDVEYKVFMFNPLQISIDDALIYLENLEFVFNKSVILTIKNYLNIYLPKYICSYINPISNLAKGYIYIGVNDNGIVSGIPFLGFISKKFISHQIDKIFNKSLKFQNNNIKKKVRTFLSVEIISVDKNINMNIDDYEKNLIHRNYLLESEKIKFEHNIYKKKKKIWNDLFDTNLLKLSDIINDPDTRKIIWSYIKVKSNYSKKYFHNKYSHLEKYCDVDNYWNLMAKINSQYKFEQLKPGEIIDVKDDYLNIYHWITLWKDSKISTLKYIKPKMPKKNIDNNYPIFLLSRSTKMIPYWLKKNSSLNLFVIKISFDIKNQYTIEYKDIENKWKKSYRTIKDGEPVSLTFE